LLHPSINATSETNPISFDGNQTVLDNFKLASTTIQAEQERIEQLEYSDSLSFRQVRYFDFQ
jgi:hypothetical protein